VILAKEETARWIVCDPLQDPCLRSTTCFIVAPPGAANINYIENSTFQYNWLHQFVCLISGSRNAITGSPSDSVSHGDYRTAFGRCSGA
jgi:hypothetical protein